MQFVQLSPRYPGRTIPKFRERGVIGAAVELAARPGPVSKGFTLLVFLGEPERTVVEYRIGVTCADAFERHYPGLPAKARAVSDREGIKYASPSF